MSRFSLQWEISSQDSGKIVREFLKEKYISRTALTDVKFNGGRISVNGQEVNVRCFLKEGDTLVCEFPKEEKSDGIIKEDIPLKIKYEDEYILIVNKPAGMNTIPSREHPTGSLANALIGYYRKIGLESTVHVVTRLDRDTSGLVLVAKHRHTHHLLSEQQKKGSVKRTYEAIAEGKINVQTGKIEKPIGRKQTSIIEREVREDGQYALTHFAVMKEFPHFTLLKLQLETGRTHQIRVHLSYIGHPLLGDDLYGGHLKLINRQALHCRSISFIHPYQESQLEFEVDLPPEMKRVLDEAENKMDK